MRTGKINAHQSGIHTGRSYRREYGRRRAAYIAMMTGSMGANEAAVKGQGSAILSDNFSDTEAALETWYHAINRGVIDLSKKGIDVSLGIDMAKFLGRGMEAGFGNEQLAAMLKVRRKSDSSVQ